MTPFDRTLAQGSAETLRDRRLVLSALPVPAGRGWNPLGTRVTDALGVHPCTIGEVIVLLGVVQTILDELPPTPARNRVSAFNALYLRITRRVAEALPAAHEPDFLEQLDVQFARLYFAALGQWNDDREETPDAWEVLFKRAGDLGLSRLGAAMLGVNAHINHDLALALVGTWAATGAPDEDRIHPDYLLVNDIFHDEIPPLRRSFSTAWQNELDAFVGGLDDWSQRLLVTTTRAHAWDQGVRLWGLRDDLDDFEAARRTMDRAASLVAEFAIAGDRVITAIGATVAGMWRRSS